MYVSAGISYGGGQMVSKITKLYYLLKHYLQVPKPIYQPAHQKEIVENLLKNQDFNHVASYVNMSTVSARNFLK